MNNLKVVKTDGSEWADLEEAREWLIREAGIIADEARVAYDEAKTAFEEALVAAGEAQVAYEEADIACDEEERVAAYEAEITSLEALSPFSKATDRGIRIDEFVEKLSLHLRDAND